MCRSRSRSRASGVDAGSLRCFVRVDYSLDDALELRAMVAADLNGIISMSRNHKDIEGR